VFVEQLITIEMKSNSEKVPGFDEIIFENRNKSYGAYKLRKGYKFITSLSILGGVFLCSATLILVSAFTPRQAIAKSDPIITVVVKPDNLIDPNKIAPPVAQKPVPVAPQNQYIVPDIVDEPEDINIVMMPADFALIRVIDGPVTDLTDSAIFVPITNEPAEREPFTFVQEPPIFPGGVQALLKFISTNIKYPAEAIENNIQGRVFVKFAVWSDGSVKRIEIMRGVHPLLDKEAERMISSLPLWRPGKQNGEPVPVWFSVPVDFQLVFN